MDGMYPIVMPAERKLVFLKEIVMLLIDYSGYKQCGRNCNAGILIWFHLFPAQLFCSLYEYRQAHCKPIRYPTLLRDYGFRSKFQLVPPYRDDDVE